MNVAHVFFVLERYNEGIRYYEPIVKKNYDNMLSLTAIVVANLCVSLNKNVLIPVYFAGAVVTMNTHK